MTLAPFLDPRKDPALRKALREARRSCKLAVRHLGPTHLETLQIRTRLATCYQQLNYLDKAMAEFTLVEDELTRQVGRHHLFTLVARANTLLVSVQATGHFGERRSDRPVERMAELGSPLVLASLETLLADTRHALGDEHPQTLLVMNNLATAYDGAGQPARAIPLFQAALAALGPDVDPSLTWALRTQLADVLQKVGRRDDAIQVFRDNIETAIELWGRGHPNLPLERASLGMALDAAGRPTEAIAEYGKALDESAEILGMDHDHTIGTRQLLAAAYLAAGQPESAALHHEIALEQLIRLRASAAEREAAEAALAAARRACP